MWNERIAPVGPMRGDADAPGSWVNVVGLAYLARRRPEMTRQEVDRSSASIHGIRAVERLTVEPMRRAGIGFQYNMCANRLRQCRHVIRSFDRLILVCLTM